MWAFRAMRVLLLALLPLQCAAGTGVKSAPFDIVTSSEDPSASELYAANRLATLLNSNVCEGIYDFQVRNKRNGSRAAIRFVLGGSTEGEEGFSLLSTDALTYTIQTDASSVSKRGTIYGAMDVLDRLGVKFLTSNVNTSAPSCPWSEFGSENIFAMLPEAYTHVPPLEERDVGFYDVSTHADFAVSIKLNHGPALSQSQGGGVVYASPPGFVHTSYHKSDGNGLVDKDSLWDSHREWFWPRDDKSAYGQLCWTNQSLVSYVIDRVRGFLKDQPDATVLSVSQNDNYLYCNDTNEQAVIAEEGSPMGPLLRAVNDIADAIKDDFPHVAIDTLAYQWSRPAPKLTKPRSNVIVRLCSIECNFGEPLTDSSNKAFQADMVDWSKVSNRTWIWNYVTDFANYVMPWPDYFSIAPNVRFFLEHGVRGLYQEGNYQSYGGDMAELKTYLMARIMFDPNLNESAVINEFLDLFYSPEAAPMIREYLDLWHAQISKTNTYLGESVPYTSEYLSPAALLESATLLNASLAAADESFRNRIQTAMLPTMYVVLLRWTEILDFASNHSIPWPYASRNVEEQFDTFAAIYKKSGATHLSEGGHDIAWLRSQLNISTTRSHLQFMMFYDFSLDTQRDIITAVSGDGASLEDMVHVFATDGIPGFPELPYVGVFDRPNHSLFANWESAVDEFCNQLTPLIANGTVVGVFLGDEIVCSGVPLENLTSVADRLRKNLGPNVALYTNECAILSGWPMVPKSLDYISVDFYDEHNTNGSAEVEKNRAYYHETIYPRLHPHQGVMFVPGIFASDPAHCKEGNVSCPLDQQAEQIVAKLDGFFAWAKSDTNVVGFNPWHFSNRSTPQLKGWWDQRLGAISMPSVVSKLREIGSWIRSHR